MSSSSPYSKDPAGPSSDGAAITPADSDLTPAARALYIGTTGDVAVQFVGRPGVNVTL